MIVIYDFDGTLTPYEMAQYEILKKCGYSDDKLLNRIDEEVKCKRAENLYDGLYKSYHNILAENGFKMTKNNICMGAKNIQYNKGVEDYFKTFSCDKTGIKHYIVTSGTKDFIEETKIRKYINRIYGVTFKYQNEVAEEVDLLVTDKKKVDIIKNIQSEKKNEETIIYFGDGLTDRFAFEYVHSIGGKNVFILVNDKSLQNYKVLNKNGIIDECFEADFSNDSKINEFIKKQFMNEKNSLLQGSFWGRRKKGTLGGNDELI